MKHQNYIFLSVCLFICTFFSLSAQSVESINSLCTNSNTEIDVANYLYKISGFTGSDKTYAVFEDIENTSKLRGDQISEKPSDSDYHYYIKITNCEEDDYFGYLYFENSGIDSLSLLVRNNNLINTYVYTEKTRVEERVVRHGNCLFPITISSNDSVKILITIAHYNLPVNTRVKLIPQNIFIHNQIKNKLFFGSYMGLEILLFLMIPLLIYFKKDYKLLTAYFLYHLILFLTVLDFYGILLQYILPLLAPFEKNVTIFLFLTFFITFLRFTSVLFGASKMKITSYLILILYSILILPTFMITLPDFYLENIVRIISFFGVLCIGVIISIVINNFSKNSILSYIYIAGAITLIAAILIRIFTYINGLDSSFFLKYILLIGAFVETVIFFLLITHLIVSSNKKYQLKLLESARVKLQQRDRMINERIRIGQELHDDLGSGLTTINYLAAKMDRENAKGVSEKTITKIKNQSNILVKSLSEIVWLMNSESESCQIFSSKLKHYINNFTDDFGIISEVTVNLNDQDETLMNNNLRRNIFLIIKESLNNIAKHSKATLCQLTINIDSTIFRLQISDNGVGFYNNNDVGNGIKNIKSRSKQIGGDISFQNKNGLQIELLVENWQNKDLI